MTLWWLVTALASAQDVPVPEGKVRAEPRRAFDATEYEALDQFRALYDQRVELKDAEIAKLRDELERRAVEQGLVTRTELESGTVPPPPSPAEQQPSRREVGPGGSGPRESSPEPAAVRSRSPASDAGVRATPAVATASSLGSALVFEVPEGSASTGTEETVVPAGSYVKVRILTGVEANARDDIPMLVQADHALVGPNHRRIDLRGCMMLLQVRGELSTDRVVGKAVRLSCVRNDGEHVSREISGYLAGEDSTFGVTGQLISRQGRVIAAASVASLADAAGAAVAAAQQTTQIVTSPLGGTPVETKNVTGNDVAYIAGSSGSAAAGLIANWYLDYADQLVPAIAVGSGRDVWVVLLDSVQVPPLAGGRR